MMPDLYIRNDVPGALKAELTSPPASIAGNTVLTGFTPQELTFIVAKHLAFYRDEHYIRNLFTTLNELKVLFFAGLRVAIPTFAVPAEMEQHVADTAKALGMYMQPVHKDGLKIVVQKFLEEGSKADLRRWMHTVELTAVRAGFLLCGDLEVAKKMIVAEQQMPGDLSPSEKVKEILLFSVSEQYFGLRKALGITVV
jgi:hypothetical protein